MALKRNYSESELARAALARGRELKRLEESYSVCVCAYPLLTYRNRSGHDSGCPAHELHMRHAEEND